MSAAFAAVTACLAVVIFFSAAGMALFLAAAGSSGLVGKVQLPLGGGERRLGLAQPGAGGLALGVGDQAGIISRLAR